MRFMKLALLGAAIALPATSAFADSITGGVNFSGGTETATINGTSTNSGSVTFSMSTVSGTPVMPRVNYSTIAFPTGSCPATGCIQSTDVVTFSNYDFSKPNTTVFSVSDADGYTLSFIAYGVTDFQNTSKTSGQLDLYGRLYLSSAAGSGLGQGSELGTFSLTNQQGAGALIGTFVAGADVTPSATPEPSSLMLLGTGLLSAAGVAVRKRRIV